MFKIFKFKKIDHKSGKWEDCHVNYIQYLGTAVSKIYQIWHESLKK